MAWLFVRLKLSLMAGGLRGAGGGTRVTGLVVAVIAGLAIMPMGFGAFATEHGKPEAAAVVATGFTIFMLGWLIFPVMLFGSDETLDPARLALLPLGPARLATGLLAAALTGIGPVVTVVILSGGVVALATGPVSAMAGVLAVLTELAMCVAGSRALITGLSGLLRSRRGRDLGFLAVGLATIAGFGVNLALQRSLSSGGLPVRPPWPSRARWSAGPRRGWRPMRSPTPPPGVTPCLAPSSRSARPLPGC